MGRSLRGSYAGAYLHVHTRGNNKRNVYADTLDRSVFLQILERSQVKYEWVVYSWCLMSNHYHLVLHVPQDGLSAGLRELNGGYARWSNLVHGRCDHVFGRRFSSHEITTDAHFVEACRYVVLNPVRAGLCDHPGDWRWSSYRACVGLEAPQTFLARDALFRLFGDVFGGQNQTPRDRYRTFVEAGIDQARRVRRERPVPGTGT